MTRTQRRDPEANGTRGARGACAARGRGEQLSARVYRQHVIAQSVSSLPSQSADVLINRQLTMIRSPRSTNK